MTTQVVQMLASLSVLAGFSLAQAKVLSTNSGLYIVLNVVGASVLSVQAIALRQWGFALLEGSWAIVSLVAFLMLLRKNGIPGRRKEKAEATTGMDTR